MAIPPLLHGPLHLLLGAIVSPPDAIAVTSILKRYNINLRLTTLLEGESLINDASAIVIYKIAMISILTGSSSLSQGSLEFVYVVLGGISVGIVIGLLLQEFSRRYLEPVLGVVFSFTIPYVTYIVADTLDVSGVLAVVVTGLIGARIIHTHHSSLRRVLGYAVWDITIILLNCLVFILIGLQVRTIAAQMSMHQTIVYSGYAFLIAFAMGVARMIWVCARAAILYIKALYSHHSSLFCPQILKETAIIGWTGMRGIVSFAVALSLPFALPNGTPLEGRNEVIFLTFVVILITLLIPGLTLPMLISRLKLRPINKKDEEKKVRKLLVEYTDEVVASLLEAKSINPKEYNSLKTISIRTTKS